MAKCVVCGKSPAPHRGKSLLTPEEEARVKAYYASFVAADGSPIYHTGHLNRSAKPTRTCHDDNTPMFASCFNDP